MKFQLVALVFTIACIFGAAVAEGSLSGAQAKEVSSKCIAKCSASCPDNTFALMEKDCKSACKKSDGVALYDADCKSCTLKTLGGECFDCVGQCLFEMNLRDPDVHEPSVLSLTDAWKISVECMEACPRSCPSNTFAIMERNCKRSCRKGSGVAMYNKACDACVIEELGQDCHDCFGQCFRSKKYFDHKIPSETVVDQATANALTEKCFGSCSDQCPANTYKLMKDNCKNVCQNGNGVVIYGIECEKCVIKYLGKACYSCFGGCYRSNNLHNPRMNLDSTVSSAQATDLTTKCMGQCPHSCPADSFKLMEESCKHVCKNENGVDFYEKNCEACVVRILGKPCHSCFGECFRDQFYYDPRTAPAMSVDQAMKVQVSCLSQCPNTCPKDTFSLMEENCKSACRKGEQVDMYGPECEACVIATLGRPCHACFGNCLYGQGSFSYELHLQRCHPQQYGGLRPEDQLQKRKVAAARNTKVETSKSKFENFIIGSVVQCGLPINYFSGDVFKKFNGPMAASLGISLENGNIAAMIIHRYQQAKSLLMKNLKKRCVHLKVDGCTRHGVQYFAVNLQYCDQGVILIKTLGVRSTDAERHTADFVKRFITEILQEFEIQIIQVLSIVTDNARNLTCGIASLRDEINIEVVLDLEVEDEVTGMVRTMTSGPITAVHMRCAAHTLQLAIRDGLSSRSLDSIIEKARSVAIAARTPVVHGVLLRYGTSLRPTVDVPTRWGSTFEMLERLLKLKNTLQQIEVLPQVPILTQEEWAAIEDVKNSLAPSYYLGKILQGEELTPGTFFSAWNSAKLDLERIGTDLSKSIKTAMDQREDMLMRNKILLAGIYVDPNYRLSLSPQQQSEGRETFLQVALLLQQLKERPIVVEIDESDFNAAASSPATTSPTTTSPTETSLAGTTTLPSPTTSRNSFENLLDQRAGETGDRIMFTEQILLVETFNRERKPVMEVIQKYPKGIKEAAEAVTALPPTQVSVERLFSAVKILVSDLRTCTSPNLLDKMVFLRLNGYEVS